MRAKKFKPSEKEIYLSTSLKSIPNNWKLELRRALANELYFPKDRISAKPQENNLMDSELPDNVIPLFGLC